MRRERQGGRRHDDGKHLRHGALISAGPRPSGTDSALTSLAVTPRSSPKEEIRLSAAHFQGGSAACTLRGHDASARYPAPAREVQALEAARANATMCNTKGKVSFLVVVEQLVC